MLTGSNHDQDTYEHFLRLPFPISPRSRLEVSRESHNKQKHIIGESDYRENFSKLKFYRKHYARSPCLYPIDYIILGYL